MEDATGSDEADVEFYCNICKVSCASAMNLQSHFLGFSHRQAEWQLRNHGDKKVPAMPAYTFEERLNSCLATEPALGLEYIYEFQKDGNSTFACKLCSIKLPLGHTFLHITGAKHRVNYLNKHHPELGTDKPYAMKGPKKLKKLKETCMEVEAKFGRKKINVVQGPIPWNFKLKDEPPSLNYGPDSNLHSIDFTNEDFSVTDSKPKKCRPKPENMSFLEMKAAHEADLLNAAASGSLSENTVETPDSDHDNEDDMTGDGGKEGNNDNDKEVCSLEPTNPDPEEFTNNKEIIDFLSSYKIFEENDIAFLLKVVGKLGNALAQYKKHCEEMEEKRISSSEFRENMDEVPSLEHTHADQETSTNSQLQVSHSISQSASSILSTDKMHPDSVTMDDQSQESMDLQSPTHASVEILPETITNSQIQVPDSTTQSTSFPTHSTDEMHPDSVTTDDQNQKFPAFKVNDKTPSNALSPDRLQESETSSKQEEIFSSVAESSFGPDSTQDAATKANESAELPAITVDDKASTRVPTSDRPQDAKGKQSYTEPLLPVSQFDPITESNPLVATAAQFSIPLHSATKDKESDEYPDFKVGNKAPTRAPTSDRLQDSAIRCNQRAEYPAFDDDKAPTRAPTSDRLQDSATRCNQRAEYPAFDDDDKAPTRATTSYRPQDAKGTRDNIRPLFSGSQFEPVTEANPLMPSAAQFSVSPDFATKGNQRVEYPAFKLGNKEPTRAPTSDRPQYSATNRNQRLEYPAFKVDDKASTRATSDRSQDSATRRNQRAEYQAFKVDDKAPTRGPKSDRPQDSATRRNQRVEYQGFKVDDRLSTRAPTSDRPQESHNRYNQNQKFPGSSWYGDKGYNSGSHTSSLPASTKPRGSPNNYNQNQKFPGSSGFNNREHNSGSHTSSLPASTKPLERNQQSFSSLTLNRGAPTTQPTHPFTSGHSQHMSQHQQFDSMSQPKKTGSAPPRAPFPHELLKQTAPRAAPRPAHPAVQRSAQPAAQRSAHPGLPVAQDKVTAQFFESIKSMEVSEVVSTLNKITATNPAFKGVHVPSLVQHLSETGKLKSTSDTPFKQ